MGLTITSLIYLSHHHLITLEKNESPLDLQSTHTTNTIMKIGEYKYVHSWDAKRQTKLIRALVWLQSRGFRVEQRLKDLDKKHPPT